MRIAYCAAPLSAGARLDRFTLLARADAFAGTVAALGFATFLPHRAIAMVIQPTYPDEPETPEIRDRCMAECLRALRALWMSSGELHVLRRPDGLLSTGCAAEVAAWESWGGKPIYWTWPIDGVLARRTE